jgi:tetratricopeptide (TPR) repeat protein
MASAAGTTTAMALRVFLCVCVIFSLAGCGRVWQSLYLSGCDRDIKKAAKSIEMAKSDAQRAVAYADRADAYAEKTRYSRAFKLISTEEYERLFGLALTDYSQAATLDPDNGEWYFRRGRTYYFRAALDLMEGMKSSDFFILAKADFSKAIEKNPGMSWPSTCGVWQTMLPAIWTPPFQTSHKKRRLIGRAGTD